MSKHFDLGFCYDFFFFLSKFSYLLVPTMVQGEPQTRNLSVAYHANNLRHLIVWILNKNHTSHLFNHF